MPPMSAGFWDRLPVPLPGVDAVLLEVWQPQSLRDVTQRRRELLHRLEREPGADAPEHGAVERLLLCIEELTSNALRHGRRPVEVRLMSYERFWMLEVTDAAPELEPSPAVDRDPATGGLGLYVVARVCGAHGWTVVDDRKTLWARIDHSRAEVLPEVLARIPKPRLRLADDT